MPDRTLEQLSSRALSRPDAGNVPAHEPDVSLETEIEPLDYERAMSMSRNDLRALAISSDSASMRVAACWRLMVEGQALPGSAPSDGLRLLLLINLASQQDLELLEVLAELDPSASVRASAATLLWRVARDRDRVVKFLVSRLSQERSSTVLAALVALEPSLPLECCGEVLVEFLRYGTPGRRRAAWNAWRALGRSFVEVAQWVWQEEAAENRRLYLRDWASSSEHASLLRLVQDENVSTPELRSEVLEELRCAGRTYRLCDVVGMFDRYYHEEILALVSGPFDADERAHLVALTGATDPDDPYLELGVELERCLRGAYASAGRTARDHELIAQLERLRQERESELRLVVDEGWEWEATEAIREGIERLDYLLAIMRS